MNDITPKEASEILRHYTNLGYGIIIEGDDVSKIIQALSLARKTLANGIPYNPTGDLISREALKKEIASYDKEFAPDWVLNCIDNAPTVESRDNFDLGYVQGLKDARPKGEWVKDYAHEEHGEAPTICSNCSYSVWDKSNFCPNCGAKMFKEEANK